MSTPNIKQVAAAALSSIERILSQWLPGGKRNGHEYVARNPTRSDSKLGSFSININTGAWADFASDDRGGDLVALVAYLEGVKQGEAAKRVAEFLGMATEKTDPPKRSASNLKKAGDATRPTQSKQTGVACRAASAGWCAAALCCTPETRQTFDALGVPQRGWAVALPSVSFRAKR